MFGKKRLQELFNKALHEGWTAPQLAKSVAIGLYIAFCPFPGAHMLLMLGLTWLLRLNFPTLFIVASINNPWTMIPMYSCDYACGYWLVHGVFGLNPALSISLHKIFGTGSICIWSFLAGGNFLGVLAAAISYPMFRIIFARVIATNNTRALL
jgi:uncharacterized protein